MSKQKQQRRYIFGRVFFPGKSNSVPPVIRLQPLGDHVGNVKRLVKHWKDFPQIEGSRARVVKAAELHDMAKPQRFSITTEPDPKKQQNGKFKKYTYSFRGHPYIVESPNLWARTLARGHHNFSVQKISEDTYKLKKASPEYASFLSQDPLAYAHELYILEMCDQIEAELACRVIGDDDQAESRTFMDYTISNADQRTYLLDPWPFQDQEIKLTFKYWSKYLSEEEQKQLQNLHEHHEDRKLGDTLDRILKTWWQAQITKPKTEPRHITLKPLSQKYLEPQDGKTVYQRLAGFSPNPMQEEMFRAIAATEHPAILLKAPTGTGKTESILFPALARGYRLFLPLPARSLLEDQKERIEKYLLKFSNPDIFPENQDREISMVVDTGSQMYRWVYKNGKDITATLNINLHRHLYKGDVILTTIDKFLYRYFSFGGKQKSFVFPLRINQPRTLICFDEAHSYDDISFTNFQSLVKALYEAGRSLVLMTATMPPELAKQFDSLETIDYTTEFSQQTERRFEWKEHLVCNREEPGDFRNPDSFQKHFADIVVNEWKSRNRRSRIIAVAESVRDAAVIYQQIKAELRCDTTSQDRWLFLYHGRIAEQLRPRLYQAIKQRDDDGQPYIVVTTSAIEVGCDLNAEVLVSQICPPENLIQRAGRCNRKGNIPDAKVIVVGDRIPDFANSLDEAGWQKYKETLRSLKHFDTCLISQSISRLQQVEDYRVVELFSMLHDYVYSADLTCQPLHKRGLIPTRSWQPAVTLVHSGTGHSISVPIDRLAKGQQYADIYAYEKRYDQENSQWDDEHLLGWGSAYGKEITVRISPAGVEVNLPPYNYDETLGFVEIPKVFVKKWTDGAEEKLLYITGQHKAVISYVKSLDE